jgi:hypothetical protein
MCLCASGAPCAAAAARGSLLALPLMEGEREPTLILAQRTIDREWGASDESTYVEVVIPDWKSEGWAMALSGVVPGAGHAYLGQNSAWIFALVEVGGWLARVHFGNQDQELRDEAAAFRGNPEDSSAVWSFERWEQATGGDPTGIRALYYEDPEEFDVRIGRDPAFADGWVQGPDPPQHEFVHYLDRADGMLDRRRYSTTAIWANHLTAALDALRAARIHNIPLQQDLRIKVKTSWRSGAPAVRAALERRF